MASSCTGVTGHSSLAATVTPSQLMQAQQKQPLCFSSLPKSKDSAIPRLQLSARPFRTVHAVATTQEDPTTPAAAQATKYHFLVANAKFMLDEEEHFQELMRERLRNFGERNREQDFWLVIEPQFLEKFPDITKRLKRPAVALVSTDELWITFMKLRLDRVLRGEIEAESLMEALKSNPTELKFEEPHTWTAPYTKYGSGWWTSFLPPGQQH